MLYFLAVTLNRALSSLIILNSLFRRFLLIPSLNLTNSETIWSEGLSFVSLVNRDFKWAYNIFVRPRISNANVSSLISKLGALSSIPGVYLGPAS